MIRLHIEAHFQALLEQEDTDGDRRITVHDRGPRLYEAEGLRVEGTYALANLLQELAAARDAGQQWLELDPEILRQPPTQRLSASIRERCWHGLTRTLDVEHLAAVLEDSKMPDRPRIYVPSDDAAAFAYYKKLQSQIPFELVQLPCSLSREFVLSLNQAPGLLALAHDGSGKPLPYVVPGGRFNELYGWDSYFIGLGLLHDGQAQMARNLVDHQVYQIRHYGQVLNANRSYYLTRSQPPFLTAFAAAVYEQLPDLDWLRGVLQTAMHEYASVWTGPARITPCGLSRYHGQGIGMPPETEGGHFDSVVASYARQRGLSIAEFEKAYLGRRLECAELDEYFRHDRTVRESGHDTSYRLEGEAAHLCTIDLNCLLYRYEVDLGELLDRHFGGQIQGYPGAAEWRLCAQRRRERVHQLCWDSKAGQFFDYHWVNQRHTGYETATGLWTLWSGLATPQQAERLLSTTLAHLTEAGGLVATSLASRGQLGPDRPARQWDYPYGWAPHQIMAWQGLAAYGFGAEASQLAYRWLKMMTRNAIDFNGVIPEKYDVVGATHEVFAEYGNVGADFDYITKEGFGWSNTSYQLGLDILSGEQRQDLDKLAEKQG